jgi:hypothetical protein
MEENVSDGRLVRRAAVLTTGLTEYGKGDYSPRNAAANYGQVSRAKIIDEKANQGPHTGADNGHHNSLGHSPMVANSQLSSKLFPT